MPIYEYRCAACNHELEALQKISDAPLLDCPACKAPQLKKQVSAAAFRLKGGGWYETDFKSGGKKNVVEGGSSGGDSGGKSEAGSSGGSDSTASSGGCGAGCTAHAH
ncbi:MAG: zinc ribbon domain-containing protein [Spongiibacteraceae bacterium]